MTQPRFDLPNHVWRCLHSGLIDWLIRAPEEVRESMMIRLDQQIDFAHFLLHILEQHRLDVFVQSTEDDVHIGICVPVRNGEAWVLFTLPGSHCSLDAEWLHAAGSLRLDEELAAILGGEQ
jgi:hypothetical protein